MNDDFGQHGMQIVNLRLLDFGIIQETAFYNDFGSCHNIVINENTGYAYAVGTKTCDGGLHQVNITVQFVLI